MPQEQVLQSVPSTILSLLDQLEVRWRGSKSNRGNRVTQGNQSIQSNLGDRNNQRNQSSQMIQSNRVAQNIQGKPIQSVKPASSASPLTGPWLICPVPGESQRDDNHLFKLIVQDKPKRNWTIEVTDTNDWSVRNHASGFHANLKYNGQTFSGREFFEHRERRSKEK